MPVHIPSLAKRGRKAIQDATTVEALVAAMRTKHAEIAELQMMACLKLRSMVTDNADNRAKAGNAGAVKAAVVAMRGHAGSVGLQRAALTMPSCMITENADNKAKAGNAGAVEAVVAAMRTHEAKKTQNCKGRCAGQCVP
jgi:hypothetical protein